MKKVLIKIVSFFVKKFNLPFLEKDVEWEGFKAPKNKQDLLFRESPEPIRFKFEKKILLNLSSLSMRDEVFFFLIENIREIPQSIKVGFVITDSLLITNVRIHDSDLLRKDDILVKNIAETILDNLKENATASQVELRFKVDVLIQDLIHRDCERNIQSRSSN